MMTALSNCTATLTYTIPIRAYQFATVPSEILGCPRCLVDTEIALDWRRFPGGVTWAIEPQIPNGATVLGNGTSATLQPGTVGTNYIVTAASTAVPSCVATTKVTVCTIESFWAEKEEYLYENGECVKYIEHYFAPMPPDQYYNDNLGISDHFEFVQHVKGYAKNSDGSYGNVDNMWGKGSLPVNFPDYVIDSARNDDPAYQTRTDIVNGVIVSTRPGHAPKGHGYNAFSVWDKPRMTDFLVGAKCDLHFKIGVYCTKGVPTSGASQNVYVGEPFFVTNWVYQFTVITNAVGQKDFTHP